MENMHRIPPHPPLREYYESSALRQRFLNGLFNQTAAHYKTVNHAVSFGSGMWHRRKALREAGLSEGMRVLDVACGPGLVTQCAAEIVGPSGYVIGLDPSTGMLREAQKGFCPSLVQGVAEALPFLDASFDFISMGYALRHVSDLSVTFRQYLRVLRPEGVVLVMEISRPRSKMLRRLSRFYVKSVLGLALTIATRNPSMHTLMNYWWDTTERCVPPEMITKTFKDVGFACTSTKEVFSGLLRDYTAVKA
ncbi:MAG: methyltransferase domain-containing protein [Nitrospiraceae bacterium]|nr:methyltransferase domain-containing protein [Nitrospiraceae bacterium]